MPLVGVLFELEFAETIPGESVYVTGERLELGGWGRDPNFIGVQLWTDPVLYPRWITPNPVWLQCAESELPSLRLEYKFVLAASVAPEELHWEQCDGNRVFAMCAEADSIWVVADQRLGLSSAPRAFRTASDEVSSRWASFLPHGALAEVARDGPTTYLLTPRLGCRARPDGADAQHRQSDMELDPSGCEGLECSSTSWQSEAHDDDEAEDEEDKVDEEHEAESDSQEEEEEEEEEEEDVSDHETVPRKAYLALVDEVRALREERALLVKTVRVLAMSQGLGDHIPALGSDTAFSELSGSESSDQCGHFFSLAEKPPLAPTCHATEGDEFSVPTPSFR